MKKIVSISIDQWLLDEIKAKDNTSSRITELITKGIWSEKEKALKEEQATQNQKKGLWSSPAMTFNGLFANSSLIFTNISNYGAKT